MLRLALILTVCAFQSAYSNQDGKIWAFLAATSNGWMNYRHQADLCHAYQLLKENGIPAENIVTMFFDDIAYNEENKDKGVIINKPGGPNVYKGVAKDYTGQDVNVKNFFNVLNGNKEAMKGIGTGRVIESGPNDHVFVYVVDHGDTGVLLFPMDEYMYAHNLTNNLRQMKKENRFKKMLMYIEACKAGSMFDNIIDDNLDVFVSTASATNEFSWARYCDTINDTCLGDYYSTVWMEHLDLIREDWSAKYTTLFKQFKYIRTNVQKSHVNIYGDFRLGFDKMSTFIGDDWVAKKSNDIQTYHHNEDNSAVPVNDLPIYLLQSKIKSAEGVNRLRLKTELTNLKMRRRMIDQVIDKIFEEMGVSDLVKDTDPSMREEHFTCYKQMIDKFNDKCLNTFKNPYVTRHFYKLANLCITGYNENDLHSAIVSSCTVQHKLLTKTY